MPYIDALSALALCLYSLDWAVAVAAAVAMAAVADVADVAAVAMSMTNMPIAHYHTMKTCPGKCTFFLDMHP